MTQGFQQQDTSQGFAIPRSAAMPQHGQKAAPKPPVAPEPRSYKARPGH